MTVINRRKLSGTGLSPAHVSDFLDSAEAGLSDLIQVAPLDAPNVTGGGTTVEVGFQLKDVNENDVAFPAVVEFAVFDDEELVTPAANATLDTEADGTILAGGGTPALKVKASPTGKFSCTLTNLVGSEKNYVGCSMTFGSRILDCEQVDEIEFSA